MDDGQIAVLGITAVGAAIWGVAKLLRMTARAGEAVVARRAAGKELARSIVERRIIELFMEFPDRDPDAIALLVHDELVNDRRKDPELFRWATAETARRLHRTAAIEAERATRRDPGRRAAAEHKPRSCPGCGRRVPVASRCSFCNAMIP